MIISNEERDEIAGGTLQIHPKALRSRRKG